MIDTAESLLLEFVEASERLASESGCNCDTCRLLWPLAARSRQYFKQTDPRPTPRMSAILNAVASEKCGYSQTITTP